VLGRRPAPVAVQLARFGFSGLGSTARRAGRAVAAWGVGAYLWGLVAVVALPLWAVFLLAWPVRARWALSRAAGRAYCAMAGIAVTVEGALPPAGRAVVVANHPSFVDGLVLVLASPSPLAFVTSTDMARHRMVGGFLRRLGCAFVERGQPEGSAGAVAGLASLAERGDRLAVFPEGSISPTPGLRPFHLGAFATAAAAGCPVVPVGIRGTRQVVRPGTYLPRRADVSVRIGAPIAPQGSGFLAQVALRDAVRAAVAELSGEADAG
jgi:1-acyl-sn-glycerol-3-phosphate acyltransferase